MDLAHRWIPPAGCRSTAARRGAGVLRDLGALEGPRGRGVDDHQATDDCQDQDPVPLEASPSAGHLRGPSATRLIRSGAAGAGNQSSPVPAGQHGPGRGRPLRSARGGGRGGLGVASARHPRPAVRRRLLLEPGDAEQADAVSAPEAIEAVLDRAGLDRGRLCTSTREVAWPLLRLARPAGAMRTESNSGVYRWCCPMTPARDNAHIVVSRRSSAGKGRPRSPR